MADRLDSALHRLADDVVFPDTPDLWPAVAARLSQPERRRWWPARLPGSAAVALIGVLVLTAAVAAVTLALPGLRISLVPGLPIASVPEDSLATRLALGRPVDPESVDAAFPAALGVPDEAYADAAGSVVSLVYHARERLPEVPGTGIGLLIQQIDGVLGDQEVQKLVVAGAATVTAVEVDGAMAYWIQGAPHLLRYTGPDGEERTEMTRLVGDALVWERDGVVYRIESALGREATISIAESVRP